MTLLKRREWLKAAAMALGSVRMSRAAPETNRRINSVLGPTAPAELGAP